MSVQQEDNAVAETATAGSFEADSLIGLVVLALRYRAVLLTMGLLGAVWGGWQGVHAERFRTVALCRLQAEGISHSARTWWEAESKSVCAELRSLYAVNHPGEILTARVEPEPWLLRLDLNHDNAGDGERRLQAVLDALNASRQRVQVRQNGESVRGTRLRQALMQLSEELAIVQAAMSDASALSAIKPGAPELRTLVMDREWRLPIEVTPYVAWYRRLSEQASAGLERLATTEVENRVVLGERLAARLENAGLEFHAYWASLDLLASTRVLPVVHSTSFSQQLRPRLTAILQGAGFWAWICSAVTFAALSVFCWYLRHRKVIAFLVSRTD
ncbi:MAG TPA: hypothetical protein DC058_23260 [Planctomycetaceae bacterium]|nr:hypothetical protein [Planctomycetaceae bacterium]HBC64122.1 hypothetical protein [Planctomycetaceae bacterium]